MGGPHNVDEPAGDFALERRLRLGARPPARRAAMALHELRRARAMTQKALGESLGVNQPAVARLERRADMHVSSLRAYVEALGGRLNIVAEFPEGSVFITNFSDAGEEREAARDRY